MAPWAAAGRSNHVASLQARSPRPSCPIYRCGGPRPGRRGSAGSWRAAGRPRCRLGLTAVLTHTPPAPWLLIADAEEIFRHLPRKPTANTRGLTVYSPLSPTVTLSVISTPLLPSRFPHVHPATSSCLEPSLPERLECGRETRVPARPGQRWDGFLSGCRGTGLISGFGQQPSPAPSGPFLL